MHLELILPPFIKSRFKTSQIMYHHSIGSSADKPKRLESVFLAPSSY